MQSRRSLNIAELPLRNILIGYAGFFLLILFVIMVSQQNTWTGLQAQATTSDTYQFLLRLRSTLTAAERAEASARGIAVTGSIHDLRTFYAARSDALRYLKGLQIEAQGITDRQQTVLRLGRDLNEHLNRLSNIVQTALTDGASAAQLSLIFDEKLKLMDAIRARAARLEAEEKDILGHSIAMSTVAASRTGALYVGIAVLVTATFLLLMHRIYTYITLKKESEEQLSKMGSTLRNKEQLLAAVLDTMLEYVIVVDRTLNVILLNRTARQLFHLPLVSLRSKPFPWETLKPTMTENMTGFDKPLIAALEGRESSDTEVEWCHDDRQPTVLSINARPLKNPDATIFGAIVVARDVTARRRLEVDLHKARDQALESVRLKSEFVANISHELRTPLTGILGLAEILTTSEDAETRELSEHILESGNNLLAIVEDLLDFSRLEAGKMRLVEEPFRIDDLVMQILENVRPLALNKQIRLTWHIDNSLPAFMLGDPARVKQVLLNLVHNAVKFTEEGSVSVTVFPSQSNRENEHSLVTFAVRDTGPGVPPEAQKTIFNAFVQADGSNTREHGGTGLGLSICKDLVQLMNGDINFETGPGGTAFFFVLPLTAATGDQSGTL